MTVAMLMGMTVGMTMLVIMGVAVRMTMLMRMIMGMAVRMTMLMGVVMIVVMMAPFNFNVAFRASAYCAHTYSTSKDLTRICVPSTTCNEKPPHLGQGSPRFCNGT